MIFFGGDFYYSFHLVFYMILYDLVQLKHVKPCFSPFEIVEGSFCTEKLQRPSKATPKQEVLRRCLNPSGILQRSSEIGGFQILTPWVSPIYVGFGGPDG